MARFDWLRTQMVRFGGLVFFVTSSLMHTSCSLKSLAMPTVSDILADASEEIETEESWQVFREATPGMIKTIEGLAYTEPNNDVLLLALTKGYSAYGFGVYETLYLKEKYQEASDTPMKQLALAHYRRGLEYGLRWLSLRGVSLSALSSAMKTNQTNQLMDQYLNERHQGDLEGAFFLGQSWLSYINLQRDIPALLVQVDTVKALMDWVCIHDPAFKQGACPIFYGSYEASRPAMLGGNPEKAKSIFAQAMKDYPSNLMIRTAYLEHYVIPRFEKELYEEQKVEILKLVALQNKPSYPGAPEFRLQPKSNQGQLFNAIALQRFRLIQQFEAELF